MPISEQELRQMIRAAIARHTGAAPPCDQPTDASSVEPGRGLRGHSSHGTLAVVPVGDGECIIEPSVRCDHCGYCRSMGH